MGLIVSTPPLTTPVTISEAKVQCRVHAADSSQDAIIQQLLDAAIANMDGPDGMLQRALEPQTWLLMLDAFSDAIELPLRPVISVDSVRYFDGNGAEQTVDPAIYTVDLASETQWVVRNAGANWPATQAGVNMVTVEFTAGYMGALDSNTYVPAVPAAIRQAIMMHVRNAFEPYDDQAAYYRSMEDLLRPFKRIILA